MSTAGKRRGRVLSYHARKGWGVLLCIDTNETFFVHHSEIKPENSEPILTGWKHSLYTGEYVTFHVGLNVHKPGKVCAKNVTGIDGGPLLCDHGAWRILFYRNGNGTKRNSNINKAQYHPVQPAPKVNGVESHSVESDNVDSTNSIVSDNSRN